MFELFRSDNLLVRSLPADDQSRWVITFDNYGIGHGFDRPGFGQEFLQASKISAIHVMGAREDWYQYPEIFEALEAVRAHVAGAERVMTYGSSMGGYAALRFAEAVGANACLALSPQYTINIARVPFEMRWSYDSGRINWLPQLEEPLSLPFRPVVAYDPRIEDAKHVALIRADTPIDEIRLPFAGHPTTTFLAEQGRLKSLVYQILSDDLDIDSFRRTAFRARHRSATCLSEMATAQPDYRQATAFALAERAVEYAPHNAIAIVALARIQSRHGHHDAAIATLRPFAKDVESQLNYYIHLAEVLAAAGHYEEALSVADQVVDHMPGMAHLLAWKAYFKWLNGDIEQAIDLVSQARELDPMNRAYLSVLNDYEAALSKRDEASSPGLIQFLISPKTSLKRMAKRLRRTAH